MSECSSWLEKEDEGRERRLNAAGVNASLPSHEELRSPYDDVDIELVIQERYRQYTRGIPKEIVIARPSNNAGVETKYILQVQRLMAQSYELVRDQHVLSSRRAEQKPQTQGVKDSKSVASSGQQELQKQ